MRSRSSFTGTASRARVLDDNDFAISGEFKTLEIKDSKACP